MAISERHGSYSERHRIAEEVMAHIIAEEDALIMSDVVQTMDAHFVYRLERVGGASAAFASQIGAHEAIAQRFKDTRP
jgi:hypothetical protein